MHLKCEGLAVNFVMIGLYFNRKRMKLQNENCFKMLKHVIFWYQQLQYNLYIF